MATEQKANPVPAPVSRPEALNGVESLQAMNRPTPATRAFSALAEKDTLIQEAIKATQGAQAPQANLGQALPEIKAPAANPAPEAPPQAPATTAKPPQGPAGDLVSEALGQSAPPGDDVVPPEFSRNFDRLTRREQEIRRREEKLQAEADELKSLRRLRERIQARVYKAVQEMGLTLEDWVSKEVEGKPHQDTEIQALRRELDDLKGWKTEAENQRAIQVQSEEINRRVGGFLQDFDRTVQAEDFGPLRDYSVVFEATNGTPLDLHQAVKQIGLEYWQRYQKDLSVSEIASILNSTAKARLARLPENEKIRSLFMASQAAAPHASPIGKPQARPAHDTSPTQSTINGELGRANTMPDEDLDRLPAAEKIRAIAARFTR